MSKERKICVIGGGAAGLMAAKYALDAGARVTLLEHNEKLGKKLYITGKGRCNLTNACEREELMKNIVRNPRFMYASLALLDNQGIMQLFEGLGVPLKVERGQRVFPQSDHASDISAALEKNLRGRGARIELNTEVSGIRTKEGRFEGVETARGFLPFDACVLATGGMSYPVTGSDG
ncbi:MAG: NAD(P)/FAD-dependent oxidoreductase, partial [Clostridia bacterium]|nr:NAD(P)/FAD-dependent oxidoreductase [Clostridia bacterium]